MPEAFRPKPAKLSKMMRARLFQLLMRNAKTPTNERLPDEARQNVLVSPPGPEQAGQRDVDCRQCAGKVSDLASEQPEPGIDVTGECLQELIDNPSAAHNSLLPVLLN